MENKPKISGLNLKKTPSAIDFTQFHKSLNFALFCLKSLLFAFLTGQTFKNKLSPS